MPNSYMVYSKPLDGSHALVTTLTAPSLEMAMIAYCLHETSLAQREGSLVIENDEQDDERWAHILDFIERTFKAHGEWQVRKLPEGLLSNRFAHPFVGEHVSDIEVHKERCLEQFGSQIAALDQAWVWYLNDGICLCFASSCNPSLPVKRYRRLWSDVNFRPWHCSHVELMDSIWLGPDSLEDG